MCVVWNGCSPRAAMLIRCMACTGPETTPFTYFPVRKKIWVWRTHALVRLPTGWTPRGFGRSWAEQVAGTGDGDMGGEL